MPQTSQSASEKWQSLRNEDIDWGAETGLLLLASEGRPISPAAIAKVANLAMEKGAKVHVLSVARIWGSAFGLPHPGLMPTARELQSQREIVSAAIDALEQRHVVATGEVMRSRNAAKAIAKKARRQTYLAIVMTADRAPHWLVRGLLWSHEPYRVGRLTRVPVHLVVDASPSESD
jgi:hypothetical protein